MTVAADLHARDDRKRTELNWPSCFISPKVPAPRTKKEKSCREVIKEYLNYDTCLHVHVYDVLELMEKAYDVGKNET